MKNCPEDKDTTCLQNVGKYFTMTHKNMPKDLNLQEYSSFLNLHNSFLMGRACGTYGGNLRGRVHLQDLDLDGRIKLKWICNK
jgi:hypothetical protein